MCPDNYHKTFQSSLHVLVCHSQMGSQENQKSVKNLKKNVVDKISNLNKFSKNIIMRYSRTAGNIFSFNDPKLRLLNIKRVKLNLMFAITLSSCCKLSQ